MAMADPSVYVCVCMYAFVLPPDILSPLKVQWKFDKRFSHAKAITYFELITLLTNVSGNDLVRVKGIHIIPFIWFINYNSTLLVFSPFQVIPSIIQIQAFLYSLSSAFIKIHAGFLWIIITQLVVHFHSIVEDNIHDEGLGAHKQYN